MAEARIELSCPGCDKAFHVAADQQGQIVDCPNCGGWVDVPDLARPPTPAELDDATADRATQDYERQHLEYARQQREYARHTDEATRQLEEAAQQLRQMGKQIEQAQQNLDLRDAMDRSHEVSLARLSLLLERWEKLTDQASRVIEHLDSRGPAKTDDS